MSSISSGGLSPRDRIQSSLLSQIAAGNIKETDQSALTTALDDIGKSLQTGRKSGGRPDPSQFKAKIDELIGNEVKSGVLTQDQASELKELFAKNAPKGGPGGAGGPPPGGPPPGGGPGGPGGPPPGGGPEKDKDDKDSSTAGTSSSSSKTSVSAALEALLKALREASQKNGIYTATASTKSSNTDATSTLVDITA